jgi:hypothetical protein
VILDNEEVIFPNINVINGVLEFLKDLPIDEDSLKDTKIMEILYSYVDPSNKCILATAKKQAQEIINKWELLLKGRVNYEHDFQPDESGYVKL